ncbi:MAG TPA: transglycosylase domain-containing protein [Rubricoccaceae bacterium]|nr:transglycosylase domain-containing protein [Rubricoccaceae bacterium]
MARRRRPGFLRRYWLALRDPTRPRRERVWLGVKGVLTLWLFGVVVLGLYVLYLIPTTPDGWELQRITSAQPTVVLAANGDKLTQFEPAHREWVPLDSVPRHVIQALIATEDRRFYEHQGVDIRRTIAATFRTLTGRREGGSTITQQLARNLFPEEIGRSATIPRKLKELVTSLKIERLHTKREILEAYLNTVPFLYNAYGIEMAARTYFNKPAYELDIHEGATLVAMLKGTSAYNPVRNPERALERRNLVLRLMAENGFLDAETAEELQEEPLGLDFHPQPGEASLAPHFTEAVRHRAEEWAREYGYDLAADGLVIRTTLDLGLQRAAEAAARRQGERLQAVVDVEWSRRAMPSLSGGITSYVGYRDRVDPFAYFWAAHGGFLNTLIRRSDAFQVAVENGEDEEEVLERLRDDDAFLDSLRRAATRLEVGLVALDPETGDVRAWVGSRDYRRDNFDHVGTARRQPGSAFKAVVYAAALQRGWGPSDLVRDEAVEVDLGNGQVWRPTNSGGGVSGAEMTLADALAYSKNTVSVQLTREVGPSRVAALGRRMGITESRLRSLPSIALGTSEVTLLEMATVYGTIANDGLRRDPRLITRIETSDGRVLAEFGSSGEMVLTRREARSLLDMLRGVIRRGTGRGLAAFGIRGDLAGKTGTSQRGADGWFLAMHPELVAGAWVGFNEPTVTFRSTWWGQGGHNALLVVGDFLRRAQEIGRLHDRHFPDAPDYGPRFDEDSLYLPLPGAYYAEDYSSEYDPFYDEDPMRGLRPEDFEQGHYDDEEYDYEDDYEGDEGEGYEPPPKPSPYDSPEDEPTVRGRLGEPQRLPPPPPTPPPDFDARDRRLGRTPPPPPAPPARDPARVRRPNQGGVGGTGADRDTTGG